MSPCAQRCLPARRQVIQAREHHSRLFVDVRIVTDAA
jgi:hypothetical protein